MNEVLSLRSLPPMPAAFARLVALLANSSTEWNEVEQAIKQDQALTASVLRLANSVRFGSPGKQFDIRRALPRLGRDTLRRFVLSQRVSPLVGGENAAFGLRRNELWRSSFGGAIASERIAAEYAPDLASIAFVAALLRDIGKLALDARFGAGYWSAVARHASDGKSFLDAEQGAFGFDHAAVGAALARRWNLPERIAAAIQVHHRPPPPGQGHDPLFDIVHAGDAVCRWAGLGVGIDGMDYTVADHVRERLGLNRTSIERHVAAVWDAVREEEESQTADNAQGAAA